MIQRAVIHVGMAKCASTFIQHQAQLAARRGIISAHVWAPWDTLINQVAIQIGVPVTPFPNASGMARPILPDRPFFGTNECLTGTFPQPLRRIETNLFSGTTMRNLQQGIISTLYSYCRRHFSEHDVHILLVTREPVSWLRSIYRNLVVMGVSQNPEDYFQRYHDVFIEWANYDRLLENFSAYFGKDKIHVMPFEELTQHPKTFSEKINDLCQSDIITDNSPKNTGLDDNVTEKIREVWSTLDRIFPANPNWQDPLVNFKQETWLFIHNNILNNEYVVNKINEHANNANIKLKIPDYLPSSINNNCTKLRSLKNFKRYSNLYNDIQA